MTIKEKSMHTQAERESRVAGALFTIAIIAALLTTAVDTQAANPWTGEWRDPTQPTQDRTDMRLPLPIARYVAAENSGDLASLAKVFAPNATVHDEGHDYAGLAAIRDWMAGTKKKYGHRMEPLEVAQRDGKSAVTMRLAGDFPGSPVTVQFVFTLARGKIESLEVSS